MLLGVLGSGGMGTVHRATTGDGRLLAVKVLEGRHERDPDLLRRFAREARIRIDHPNVVEVLDAGADERSPTTSRSDSERGVSGVGGLAVVGPDGGALGRGAPGLRETAQPGFARS